MTLPAYATTTHIDHANGNDWTVIVLHSTPIVKFNHERIILNTGGWCTNTTKRRMNQVSEHFNLGFNVYQKDFEWFVNYKRQTIEFNDNTLTLER